MLPVPLDEALRNAEKPIPSDQQLRAQIDTGASSTCVAQRTIDRLGVLPIGYATIRTPSSTGFDVAEYEIRLIIHPGITWDGPVIGLPSLDAQDVDCLIGRDILAETVLVYNGPANQFTLAI